MAHHIHISNRLNQDLHVLAFPNPDWVWADMAVSLASLGSSGIKAVKSATDLWKAIYIIKGLGTASGAGLKLTEFFKENGCVISPNDSKNVYDKTNWNITSPSYWGAVLGASTVTLVICSADLSLSAQFNSNDDFSWIAGDRDILRAHYGRLWVPDPNAGAVDWDAVPPCSMNHRQGYFSTPRSSLALWQPYGSPLFFAQGTDHRWDVGSIQTHGCYTGPLNSGEWANYYESLSTYEATIDENGSKKDAFFCFMQRSNDGVWSIQRMDPSGTWGSETDTGTMSKFYPVTLSFGICNCDKWSESIDTGSKTVTVRKSKITPKYLFGHAPDKSWFLREMNHDGKMGKEIGRGTWNDYYSSCAVISVGNIEYLVGQSQSTRRWFMQPFQKNSFGNESDYGTWSEYFPVITSFTIGGRYYLFRQNEFGTWYINEISTKGKMSEVIDWGAGTLHKKTISFRARGRNYLLMIAEYEWSIKEISVNSGTFSLLDM
jgi:hypothetical protein